jgi:hypothetical protein
MKRFHSRYYVLAWFFSLFFSTGGLAKTFNTVETFSPEYTRRIPLSNYIAGSNLNYDFQSCFEVSASSPVLQRDKNKKPSGRLSQGDRC